MDPEKKHKLIRSIFIAIVFVLFAMTFWPFLTELLLAALFAFAFHDLTEKLSAKKIKRVYASLIVTFGVILFIASPLIYITLKTISTVRDYTREGLQNTPFYQVTEKLLQDFNVYMASIAERLNLDITKLPDPTELLSQYSGSIGSYTTTVLSKIPHLTLSTFIFFLVFFYFLNSSKKIKTQFLKFDLLSIVETDQIVRILKSSSYLTLAVSLLIAATQAFIIALFASFSGYHEFFIIYVTAFVFALIPIVGSLPVSGFLILISYIQGDNKAAIIMLVAALIAGSSDNLIRAFILSSSEDDLPPILSLITIIGAIIVYGAIGILIGPIITRLALNIVQILRPGEKSGAFKAESDL